MLLNQLPVRIRANTEKLVVLFCYNSCMYTREEIEDFVDDVAFDENFKNAQELAERIAPGRQDIRQILEDLHNTYHVDDHVLRHYADRLERALV